MRSRTAGMWWGTAIEAPDPAGLARFYSDLLSWPIGHEEPGTAIVAAPEGSIYIVFQEAADDQPPVWPPAEGLQRPMMHFDFQVGDLDSSVAEAVALGATVAAHQPRTNVRVLFDPAGHPFCLCRKTEGTYPRRIVTYLSLPAASSGSTATCRSTRSPARAASGKAPRSAPAYSSIADSFEWHNGGVDNGRDHQLPRHDNKATLVTAASRGGHAAAGMGVVSAYTAKAPSNDEMAGRAGASDRAGRRRRISQRRNY